MRRSPIGWRGRLSDSKSSAPVAPRAVRTRGPLGLTAVPDRRRRLSDGVLVEASILARVLGIRLLTLDTTVVLVPADVRAPSTASHDPPARTSAPSSGVPPTQSGAAGHGLAEAVRSINEGAELLAKARRNGS